MNHDLQYIPALLLLQSHDPINLILVNLETELLLLLRPRVVLAQTTLELVLAYKWNEFVLICEDKF